jgi:hypothetical protein
LIALRWASGVFLAFIAGWEAGGWLKGQLDKAAESQSGVKGETFGGLLHDWIHGESGAKFEFRPDGTLAKVPQAAGPTPQWVAAQERQMANYVPRRRPDGPPVYHAGQQPGAQPPIEVTTNVNLDGKQVASVVTKHQAREVSRPFASTGALDPTLLVSPVGGN